MVARSMEDRLQRDGSDALGDDELLAIVLGHRTVRAAGRLLADAGGVGGLYQRVSGGGHSLARETAAAVQAALALGRRSMPPQRRTRLTGAASAAGYLMPLYGHLGNEQTGVLSLDSKGGVIRDDILTKGTLDTSLVHPRDVFRAALRNNAASIVLYHNHPSGDPTPSQDDEALTIRFRQASDIMGVNLTDHIIVAANAYYSFADQGWL